MRRRDLLWSAAALRADIRPNIIFILVDDLRFDELGCAGHPFIQSPHADRLAREGVSFSNAFATTPLCSPSRACFLTGSYAHSNGVTDNVARDALSHRLVTWPRLLHDSGYATAFLGKWHMGNDDSPRPGFDRWVSFRGQGECFNPALNVDGKQVSSTGYVTDILTDYAVAFIEQRRSRQTPFCVYLSHKAVHPNIVQNNDGSIDLSKSDDPQAFLAAGRHQNLYAGKTPPRRANYLAPPNGKPALQRALDGVAPLSARTATSDEAILNRARMLKAVDESLGSVLAALERNKQLDRTMVIFTSDHGYFYGEHCLGPERRLAYEEVIRIPLLVRYPDRFPPRVESRLVLSVDVAATALSAAGIRLPQSIHGRPLWARARRDAVLVEYFDDIVFPRIRNMGYSAIRTERWKYIHYHGLKDAHELYDLASDPFELKNRVAERGVPLARLRSRLNRLMAETGDPRTLGT